MNIKSWSYLSFLLCLVILLCSCGGGSSDGSSPRNVSGTWQGALTKVTDTCTSAATQQNISHVVTQNQGAVVLTDSGDTTYIGNVVGEDGFSVDGSKAAGQNCSDAIQIEYNDINEDDDSTTSINLTTVRSCAGQADCRIEFTGTGTRVTGAATPVPTGTQTPPSQTTPIAGGCSAMNPNPASGEYAGDGGCGISSTKFSIITGAQDTVVLEPFGGNGATSFVVATPGSSAANSTRTDLTIAGTTGYACSLACSAPGTFTATCFKEGGTTCVEKF